MSGIIFVCPFRHMVP